MEYYTINNSDNLKEIGFYPQTDFYKGYNPVLANSIWQVKPDEFPDFKLNYELELNKNAIPTNYLDGTSSPPGIIVDNKLKSIFEKFSLPPHHFYPIKVYHVGKLLDYYCFHFIINDFLELC